MGFLSNSQLTALFFAAVVLVSLVNLQADLRHWEVEAPPARARVLLGEEERPWREGLPGEEEAPLQPGGVIFQDPPPRGSGSVHFLEYSEDLLRKDELDNWGRRYAPNRLICALPTSYPQNAHRLRRIDRTWGAHCDKLLFVVEEGSEIATNFTHGVFVPIKLTRPADPKARNIWDKVWHMWIMLADRYLNEGEWFMKVDDDTFLYPTAMRRFTRWYNPAVPHYVGHAAPFRMWAIQNIAFNLGAAYGMSRAALRKLAFRVRNMPRLEDIGGSRQRCIDRVGAGEDEGTGTCFRTLGINPENVLDARGRERFFPFTVATHKKMKNDRETNDPRNPAGWYWRYKSRKVGELENCCVEDYICQHRFKPNDQATEDKFTRMYAELLEREKKEWTEVPPKPRWYPLDDDLPFKLDRWRNNIDHPPDQDVFLGYEAPEAKYKQYV